MVRKKTTRTVKKAATAVASAAPVVAVAQIALQRRHTFNQWASVRSVKNHHRGGLLAFCINPHAPRTLDEWDACFKDY